MKTVILDGHTAVLNDLNWDNLNKFGEVIAYERTAPEDYLERIGDAEVVLTSKCRLTREVLSACPNLKLVCLIATGYDNVDVRAAKELGIAVCNVPAYSTEAVAQHTMAMILELSNNVGLHNQAILDGEWAASPDFCFLKKPIMQLNGKSLGIVGYGNIGKRVAQLAQVFGMRINVYSKDKEACMKSDIISLHCPATPENTGFVNAEFISQMKDGAMIINTARGVLINAEDLADALRSGKLAGAALDVVAGEPAPIDHPLMNVPNLILTPHIAWMTTEARMTILEVTEKNIESFLEGGTLNRVNL